MSETPERIFQGINPFQDFPSSTWEAEQWASQHFLNPLFPKQLFPWKRWPGAPNFIVQRDIWACQDGWWAYIKFSEYALLNLFWTAFIPSPVEVERKILLGSYRCSFYFFPKIKSPLQLVIGEDGVSILAKLARPVTTVLFWWWAAETAWSALDTAQTIFYKDEFCDDLENVVVAEDAETPFAVDADGAIVYGWHEVTDPGGHFNPGTGILAIPAGDFTIRASAHFVHTAGTSVSNCAIWLDINGVVWDLQNFDNDKVNAGRSRMVSINGHANQSIIATLRFKATRSPGAPPFSIGIVGDVFSAAWTPD